MNPSERTICFRKGAKKCVIFNNAGAKISKILEKEEWRTGKVNKNTKKWIIVLYELIDLY